MAAIIMGTIILGTEVLEIITINLANSLDSSTLEIILTTINKTLEIILTTINIDLLQALRLQVSLTTINSTLEIILITIKTNQTIIIIISQALIINLIRTTGLVAKTINLINKVINLANKTTSNKTTDLVIINLANSPIVSMGRINTNKINSIKIRLEGIHKISNGSQAINMG